MFYKDHEQLDLFFKSSQIYHKKQTKTKSLFFTHQIQRPSNID